MSRFDKKGKNITLLSAIFGWLHNKVEQTLLDNQKAFEVNRNKRVCLYKSLMYGLKINGFEIHILSSLRRQKFPRFPSKPIGVSLRWNKIIRAFHSFRKISSCFLIRALLTPIFALKEKKKFWATCGHILYSTTISSDWIWNRKSSWFAMYLKLISVHKQPVPSH